MSKIQQLADCRWYWRGIVSGRELEAWATIDVDSQHISFLEEPIAHAAKRHEGGGASYSLNRFRRGHAQGWHKSHPDLYSVVCKYLDKHFPE
jgi:hypothetical protein